MRMKMLLHVLHLLLLLLLLLLLVVVVVVVLLHLLLLLLLFLVVVMVVLGMVVELMVLMVQMCGHGHLVLGLCARHHHWGNNTPPGLCLPLRQGGDRNPKALGRRPQRQRSLSLPQSLRTRLQRHHHILRPVAAIPLFVASTTPLLLLLLLLLLFLLLLPSTGGSEWGCVGCRVRICVAVCVGDGACCCD